MNNFTEFPLSPNLQHNLANNGFVRPTPVQVEAIPQQLAGHDLVITAQTGTGKTLAFLLPLLEKLMLEKLMQDKPGKPESEKPASGVRALILCPTRELAIQTNQTFQKLATGTGIRSAVVVGGLNQNSQLQSIRKGAQVVIATPGRLSDFLERSLVKLGATQTLVLDEADRMLDMGFLPTIKNILGTLPPGRQTIFCSATIESSVSHLIKTHLKNPVRIAIGSVTKPAEHIELHVYEVEQDRKLSLLEKMLQDEHGSFLVFARTKHGADRLAKKLERGGSKTTSIHGNRSQSQRNQALRGFQDGSFRVLVATDVAARGVHVEGIAHVINYDLPQVPEDFIHRVGRTGRAGLRGTASTFTTKSERGEIRKIERLLELQLTRRQVPAGLLQEKASAGESSHERSRPARSSAGSAFSKAPRSFSPRSSSPHGSSTAAHGSFKGPRSPFSNGSRSPSKTPKRSTFRKTA